MELHQIRIQTERDELEVKYTALIAFTATPTFHHLPAIDSALLLQQSAFMAQYLHCLEMRIAQFKS